MDIDTLKKVGKGAGAAGVGGVGAAGVLLIVVNTIWSDMKSELKDTHKELAEVSTRLARIEGRQEKLVEFQEWIHGSSERLEEVKKD